jgi:hypothetical protein
VRHTLFIVTLFFTSILDAQTWSSVGTGIKGSFTQFITYNNKLLASGIDSLNTRAVHFASWDGNSWHSADTGLKGTITAMAIYEGKIYAGTTEKSGANAVYRLMCWNDTLWTKVSTLNGPINALCAFKGSLYAGGKFTMADTTRVKFMARWNDTTWNAVGRNVSNNVRAIAVYHNKLYIGGQFSEVLWWNGRSWETAMGKTTQFKEYVKSFCIYNDELYACGEFSYLSKWNTEDWNESGAMNDGASALAVYNSQLYMGGDFISVPNNNYANHVASYDVISKTWSCLGGVFYSAGDCKPYSGTVWALAEYKGYLYIGGQFMIAGGKLMNNIARLKVPEKN